MKENIRTIQNETMSVQVNLFGARLWSIKDAEDTEYLWQGDEKYWGDRAPVLFPYIARLTDRKYILNDHEYEMDIHGFAKDSKFEVVKHTESELTLKIKNTDETYAQYPYQFVFEITYKLEGDRLDVIFHVENKDIKTMYFGVGGHPGFNVPLQDGETFEDYYLEFIGEGEAKKVLTSEACFVLGQTKEFPLLGGTKIPLSHDLFDHGAIILSNMPKRIELRSKTGNKSVCVEYQDMDYLGLWHWPRTDAPYICIEPWSSLPSRKNVVEDFAKQENLVLLPGGETKAICWSIQIRAEKL